MKKLTVVLLTFLIGFNTVAAENWWSDAVFYEIFVRSFYDSDGDGVGDLNGMTEKLDYLNDGDPATDTDLEIDGIWLMPIFESGSYHGYDTDDYYAIDEEYGTMEDFEAFIAAAHERGIKVILDLVINHSSDDIDWFVNSVDRIDPYTDFYSWRDDLPVGEGWKVPWGGGSASSVWHYNKTRGQYFYGAFWSGMPDLNYDSEALREEIKSVAKFWLDKGVDGFRLDAARYLYELSADAQADAPETIQWWIDFNEYVKSVNEDTMLVGEVWTESENIKKYYQDGKGLDMCFDFDFASYVKGVAKMGKTDNYVEFWEEKIDDDTPDSFYALFIANHDTMRAFSYIGEGKFDRMELAAVLLLTSPGTPFLYYGEEIGIYQGEGTGDQAKRTPMQWNSTPDTAGFTTGTPWYDPATTESTYTVSFQTHYPGTLLDAYRKLIRIRKDNPEFRSLNIEFIDTGEDSKVIAFQRTDDDGAEISYVVANGSLESAEIELSFLSSASFADLMSGTTNTYPDGLVALDGKSYLILKQL